MATTNQMCIVLVESNTNFGGVYSDILGNTIYTNEQDARAALKSYIELCKEDEYNWVHRFIDEYNNGTYDKYNDCTFDEDELLGHYCYDDWNGNRFEINLIHLDVK